MKRIPDFLYRVENERDVAQCLKDLAEFIHTEQGELRTLCFAARRADSFLLAADKLRRIASQLRSEKGGPHEP